MGFQLASLRRLSTKTDAYPTRSFLGRGVEDDCRNPDRARKVPSSSERTELSYPTRSKPCSARDRSFDTVHCVHASSPDGRASRPAIRAASTLASGELEENLECEGEGTAAVDEVARLAEIGGL